MLELRRKESRRSIFQRRGFSWNPILLFLGYNSIGKMFQKPWGVIRIATKWWTYLSFKKELSWNDRTFFAFFFKINGFCFIFLLLLLIKKMDAFMASDIHILLSEAFLSSSFLADYVFLEQLWCARCARLGILRGFKIREKLSSYLLLWGWLIFIQKRNFSKDIWVLFIEVQSGYLIGLFNFYNMVLCFKMR